MAYKKQILKSFAVGKYLRLIQADVPVNEEESSNKIYKSYNFSKDESYASCFYNKAINFHYLIKDVTSFKIHENYSPFFIDFLKSNIYSNKSEVYYNTDIMTFDDSKNILQYNQRCYFLGKNQYQQNISKVPSIHVRTDIINGTVTSLDSSYECPWTESEGIRK